MKTFLQFLIESALNEIPKDVLGISISTKQLPQYPPYGFWVDPHGNFIPVVEETGHSDVAETMIFKAKQWLKENGKDSHIGGYSYDVMFKAGWIRVMLSGYTKTVFFELIKTAQPTMAQLKTLREIKDHYEFEFVKRDT